MLTGVLTTTIHGQTLRSLVKDVVWS